MLHINFGKRNPLVLEKRFSPAAIAAIVCGVDGDFFQVTKILILLIILTNLPSKIMTRNLFEIKPIDSYASWEQTKLTKMEV